MPIKKKHTKRNAIIIWIAVILLIVLMVISFAPVQHVTEVVLF